MTWAPIMSKRAAPRRDASTRRWPRTGSAGCENSGSGASRLRIRDKSRSCRRSASGWILRRERSKAGKGMKRPLARRMRHYAETVFECLDTNLLAVADGTAVVLGEVEIELRLQGLVEGSH